MPSQRLVVGADDRCDWIRKCDALQNFRPDEWMYLHLLEFFWGEFAGLVDDLFGHCQFSDVVQQGGGPESLNLIVRQV